MRPLRFEFAGAPAPTSFLRLLLSLLLATFVVGGQALAQKAPATPMLAPPPPEDDDVLYNNASMVTQSVPSTMVVGGLGSVLPPTRSRSPYANRSTMPNPRGKPYRRKWKQAGGMPFRYRW